MTDTLSPLEHIKLKSRFLRGTIDQGLADRTTGSISEPDTKLLKFHGSYMQDDRDIRDQRRRQKLEPDYRFMVRVRLPGGVLSPEQWLALDALSLQYASRGLRITTRQTFQYHGVRKEHLRDVIGGINAVGLSTLAACGDDVRNVVASVNPLLSGAHAEVHDWSLKLMEHVRPRTTGYQELWIEKREQTSDGSQDEEPLLGPAYLPRKFKFGIAIPPYNDIDVFSQDIGLVAILDADGQLAGFNLAAGGSMGGDRGEKPTYARLGDLVGYVPKAHLLEAAWHCVTIQRDFGDRCDRMHARLKYTIDDHGLQWFKDQLQARVGFRIEPARPYRFEHNGDRFGWLRGDDGNWHLTLQIPAGRLWDNEQTTRQTGMREIARVHQGELRMTCNQNVIIANVAEADRAAIDALVARHGLDDYQRSSPVRQRAIACVAFPTCGLAMAESERYLPTILGKLEALLAKHGIQDEPLHFRISGCPNGCSRPYLGEIALVGRSIGRYDLRIGADQEGERMNALYRENINEEAILAALDELFARFVQERQAGEAFGNFVVRAGVVQAPPRREPVSFGAPA